MTVTTALQGFFSQAGFTSLLLLSSKGKNPAQSESDSIAGKKVFFGGGNHTQLYVSLDLGF